MNPVEEISRQAYLECAKRMDDPAFSEEVTHGLTILYGPPMERPDLMILSFQGGGENPIVQSHWPSRLYYLDDPYRIGSASRSLCAEAGLADVLERRTMALPVVFPQAKVSEAASWLRKTGPKAKWREFLRHWVVEIIRAADPAAILIFWEKTGRVLNIDWRDCERRHAQGHLTFAEAQTFGRPAVFCHHLSQGYVRAEALKCLRRIGQRIAGRNAA